MKEGQMEQIGTPGEILSSPASKYVEDFIQDINKSKLVRAKDLMIPEPVLVTVDKNIDGIIAEMKARNASYAYVIDADRRVSRVVTAEEVIRGPQTGRGLALGPIIGP